MTTRDRARFRPEGKRPSARRGFVDVDVNNGDAARVPAERRGVWALHRQLTYDERGKSLVLSERWWTVTHAPSGRAARAGMSRTVAEGLLTKLHALVPHMDAASASQLAIAKRAVEATYEVPW